METDVSCSFSVVVQADGSGEFRLKNTSAIASIYGPNEMKQAKELINDMNIEVFIKPKVNNQLKEKMQLEKFLTNICLDTVFVKDFPKSNLVITVQEVENDGSLLACLINALSVSLLESALPLKNVFAAVNVGVDTNGQMIVNPSLKKELTLPSTTFVLCKNGDVISSQTNKIITETIYEKSLKTALDYVPTIFDAFKKEVSSFY